MCVDPAVAFLSSWFYSNKIQGEDLFDIPAKADMKSKISLVNCHRLEGFYLFRCVIKSRGWGIGESIRNNILRTINFTGRILIQSIRRIPAVGCYFLEIDEIITLEVLVILILLVASKQWAVLTSPDLDAKSKPCWIITNKTNNNDNYDSERNNGWNIHL